MKRLCLYITIGCVNLGFSLFGQYKNIRIEHNPSHPYEGPVEPSIAINPKNGNEIAIGSVLDDYFYSMDNGKTWIGRTLHSPYGVYGDPVLTFDAKGRLYYFHLANYNLGTWIDRIICQYTDKIDAPFSEGTFPAPNGNKVQDKHWIDIQPKTNHIFMTWTQFDKYESNDSKDSTVIMFSKSENRGESWSNPKRISFYSGDCLDRDNTVEGAVPVVSNDGSVYVVWTGPKGLVFQKSKDKGETWLAVEKQITPQVGGWDLNIPGIFRCNGLPTMQMDRSGGAHDGDLYITWSDQKKGAKNTDVWLIKSSDEGETWSEPIKVNQDQGESHQFFAAMTIDQSNGHLHWVYYDRRNYKPGDLRTEVIWATSKDGGKTIEEKVISERPFVPKSKIFFGDYIAIAADNGVIHPVWVRMDMGKTSLWTTTIGE